MQGLSIFQLPKFLTQFKPIFFKLKLRDRLFKISTI